MLKYLEFIILVGLVVAVGVLAHEVVGMNRQLAGVRPAATSTPAAENREAVPEAREDSLAALLEDAKVYTDKSVATLAAAPKAPVPQTQIPVSRSPETYYVPLGSTFSATSTDWVDIPDSKIYIDLAGEYGESARAFLEVNLKVAHGNGQAYARLFDETHGIAVAGSELTTTNNVDYKQVGSGELAIWRGRNLYKLQLKSLNSFEVTASGAKLKVAVR